MCIKYRIFSILTVIFVGVVLCPIRVQGYEKNFNTVDERLRNKTFSSNKDIAEVSFQGIEDGYQNKFKDSSDGFKPRAAKKSEGFNTVRSLSEKRFAKQTRDDNKKYLKKKLDDKGSLSESEKRYLVKYFDKYYADRAALNKGNDSASVNAFITIAHDQTKSLRQKRDALEQYLNEGE